jgi:hypothetical protein
MVIMELPSYRVNNYHHGDNVVTRVSSESYDHGEPWFLSRRLMDAEAMLRCNAHC